jgi:tripartite-type tricarboxylate transporter receptor subunit TctC
MIPMRRSVLTALVAALALPVAGHAQSTDRGVRIVIGFPPGGSADTLARTLADRLKDELKQPVVVENRPGAGGRLALELSKAMPADGSVAVLSPDAMLVTAPLVFSKLNYDPVRDFAPVGNVVDFQFAFAAGTNPPAKTLDEFVKWGKDNPGKASFGSPAAGSPIHFFGALVGKETGVDMIHVPYQGGAPLVTNLVGGQITAGINTLADMIEHHRGGRIRILAVSASTRAPQLPEVPTFTELGYPNIVGGGSYGLYLPARAPRAAVEQWNAAIRRVLADPAVAERLRSFGFDPAPSSPEALADKLQAETARWAPIVKSTGFRAD